MKYSELISFNPIEDVIQLVTANDKDKAREYVKSYIMSDKMADNLSYSVIDQLQLEETVDNKGVLIVGNYGTGKSHLMSVISAVATDATNLQYLQNKKFAEKMSKIAGHFEVLRLEINGITMSLREVIFSYIQEDFEKRGIYYEIPDFSKVKDNKRIIKDMMEVFNSSYPGKGYLLVVDEFLAFLKGKDKQTDIVLDLAFLQALSEVCKETGLRIILGVQEKIFDNPKFSFVSDTLKTVSDRFTQVIITKEDTSLVVSERILKKTPEQKAMIRKHLEKFSNLYGGMSSRMEDYVDLFPIHPSYIDVFNKLYLIENRHILKNISLTIKDIFNTKVPDDAPGIISFDDYWKAIKANMTLHTDPTISRVLEASQKLEDIITMNYQDKFTKNLALQIIYALSVHRLTTNGLDFQFGLTAEGLKDDLCLFTMMPEQDADFLLGIIKTTLKKIMTTVSGQFIIFNESNNQYFIDVDKTVDYDERIKQKATLVSDSEMNSFFYGVVYNCLEWDAKQYVTNFQIYEYDLNWNSHNIFREGYLFMGLPGERSTAQPERDFYVHIMPPYDDNAPAVANLDDEVYFYFKSNEDFKEKLRLFTAASQLAQISDGKDKESYTSKANMLRKNLVKYLGDNKNTCFDVVYKKQKKQLIEILHGLHVNDYTFKDTIDLAASLCLDDYFCSIYPEHPVMKTKITRANMANNASAAFDQFAGRKPTQQSMAMLESFGIMDGDKINPLGSKYASYYIDMMKNLPPQGVVNYSDIFEPQFMNWQIDKKFRIGYLFTPIIFLAMVYGGYAEITFKDGTKLNASNMEKVAQIGSLDLYEFKYLSKPAQSSMTEIKKLFGIIGLNPAMIDNPNTQKDACEKLIEKAKELSYSAVIARKKVEEDFALWGEPLANAKQIQMFRNACDAVGSEFTNYSAKYNTPAKLNNFTLSLDDVDKLGENIKLLVTIGEYVKFKADCSAVVAYISSIEFNIGEKLKSEIDIAKASFRETRDGIMDGASAEMSSQKVIASLEAIKDKYIKAYIEEHKKKRLDIDDTKRRGKIQESQPFANLKKLRKIDILSTAKLTAIEQDLAGLVSCYQLTTEEMKTSPVCPHCRFNLNDNAKNIFGQMDNIDNRIDDLVTEWTNTLINTISDPLVINQKEFLSKDQKKVIEEFIDTGKLPAKVDDFFVDSISALLKGFKPVVIDSDNLVHKLSELGPCDIATFNAKIAEVVKTYTKGEDASNLRIVIKKRED